MPLDLADLSVNAHLVGQPGSRAALSTPALVLDLDIMEANIAAMLSWTKAKGLRIRPHAKTHKSVTIAKMLVDAGAVGACCATLGEAEALAGGWNITFEIAAPRRHNGGARHRNAVLLVHCDLVALNANIFLEPTIGVHAHEGLRRRR